MQWLGERRRERGAETDQQCTKAIPVRAALFPPQGISQEGAERELIVRALEKFNWNQTHAARHPDISRKTLIYRMEKFGLRKEPGGPEEAQA